MKRGSKLLSLLLVLAVICVGAWVVTRLTAQEEAPETADSGQSVFTLDRESLSSLTWTYADNTLTFRKAEDGWVCSEDAAYPLNESYMDDILAALADIKADKVIEEPGELAQFGLSEPACTVTVDSTTLLLGDETAVGGQRYFSNGDGKVYLVDSSILDCFTYDLLDMVQEETIPDLSHITALTLTTEEETLSLSYQENSGLAYSDHYCWFDAEGSPMDMENIQTLLNRFSSLAWTECVDYQAEGDGLAAYGLDTPAAVYTLAYTITTQVDTGTTDENGDTVYETQEQTGVFTLELGDGADTENCYARLGGSRLVYLIDAEVSTALIDVSRASLLPDDVLKLDLAEVLSAEITLDGSTYLAEKVTTQQTDEDGNTTEETVWTLDGGQIDIGAVLESLTGLTGDPSGAGMTVTRSAEVSFLLHRSADDVVLTFYQYDGSNCLVSLNGETTLLIPRTDVVAVMESINVLVL